MNHADLNPELAEEAVAGSCLYEPGCIGRAARLVKPEHFYSPVYRQMFATCYELWQEGIAVDLVTVAHRLMKNGKLESVGGAYGLSLATNRVAQTIHLEHHCAIIREQYNLRVIRETGLGMVTEANVGSDPDELIAKLNVNIAKASGSDISNDVNAGERAFHMLNEPEGPKPYYLGMKQVDDFVFIRPGNVVTISAHSGVGKTAFVLSAALNLISRLKPWIVSLEMPADELITRALCQLAEVDMDFAMEGRLNGEMKERMAQAALRHGADLSRLDIDDSGHMTIDNFKAKAEHKVKTEGVGLIIVDYAQLMEADRKVYPNEALQNEAISKGIRAVARSLDVPILLVVHLNRAGEAHGSTQYEKDAHVRLVLTRENGANVMGVDIRKNRNGRAGQVNTPCEMRYGLVGNTKQPF